MDEPTQQLVKQARSGDGSPGTLVIRFFDLLNDNNITWAVLRGSDQLPDRIRYDIDVLVAPRDLARTESLIDRAIRESGWKRFALINKFQYRCHIVASPGPERRFLPIDLFTGCDHRFYSLGNAEIALANRRLIAPGIWAVPPGFGAVVALFKELMRHDTFKENSRGEVNRAAMSDADTFEKTARESVGMSLAGRLLQACQQNDWRTIEGFAPEIRRRIRRFRPALLPAACGFFIKSVSHHFRRSVGTFIVLLGPDGSGKSTVATELCQRLYQKPFKLCKQFEYNFRILPPLKSYLTLLRKLLGRPDRSYDVPIAGTPGSGMNKEHSALRAMIYIAYYSLDLMLGRLYLRKLRGQSALIVFARYFYDYYYQKGYRCAPRFWLGIMEKLIPQPDLIVYLDRNADEIYASKPELDVQEIQRQQVVIRDLIKARSNAFSIDASHGVNATVEHVRQLILDSVLARSAG